MSARRLAAYIAVVYDYDGFLSYSHAADRRLSAALQSALRRFAKPWYRRRALRVFRDQSDLSLNPSLWSVVAAAMERSSFFVLLASPKAAASEWVRREVAHWVERRGTERILIVVTRGRVHWDQAGRRFDPERTDAIPPSLLTAFPDEPLYLDLRWAVRETSLSLEHPDFRDAVATLAAAMHGRPKDDLLGEDIEQHRRTRRVAWTAATGLVLLTTASVVGAVVAVQQRSVAEAERRVALSRQLAAQATVLLDQSPQELDLALALSIESSRIQRSVESDRALRAALALAPDESRRFEYHDRYQPTRGRIRALASSADGRLLGAAREDGTAQVWDLARGDSLFTIFHTEADIERSTFTLELDGEDAQPLAATTIQGSDETTRLTAPGYGHEVTALAFSPDGSRVASASNDGTARIWRTSDGVEVARLSHEGPVSAVAFDSTGEVLATGSADGTARLWQARSGAEMARHEHAEEVGHLAFSPDGRVLAALGEAGEITLVDVGGGPARTWWSGSGFSYGGLVFSSDGTLLATGHDEGARVWSVRTGEELVHVTHTDFSGELNYNSPIGIYDVAFSPDGAYLATASRDASARIWEVTSGAEIVRLRHGASVRRVAFQGDGSTLATAADDGLARLWEVPSGREIIRAAHGGTETVLTWISKGETMATGNDLGLVQVWRMQRGDQVAQMRHPAALVRVAFHPLGESVATVDEDDAVRVWGLDGALRAERIDREDLALPWFNIRQLAFNEDGRTLVATGQRPTLAVLNPGGGFEVRVLADYPRFDDAWLSARHVAAVDRSDGSIRIWPLEAPDTSLTLPAEGVRDARFDPTGAFLVTQHDDEIFRVWEVTGRVTVGSVRSERSVTDFALDPSGTFLALATSELGEERPGIYPPRESLPFVHVWDYRSGKLAARLPQPAEVRGVLFDRTGGLLVTVTESAVQVWTAPSFEGEPRLFLHRGSVGALRISADGAYIGTESNGRVRVWSTLDGRLASELADRGHIRDFAFAPDGQYVLTGGTSRQTILWWWRSEDLFAEACRRLVRPLTEAEWRQYVGEGPYRPACST